MQAARGVLWARRMKSRIAVALAFVLGGCVAPTDDSLGQSDDLIEIPASDRAALDLVNYPGTTVETLDDRAALDFRAAEGIIALRNGPDGVSPSADDHAFSSIAEIDAVPYVGAAALARLRSYAQLFPAPAAATVEGVAFAGWEAEAIVWGVNGASVAMLDDSVGLDKRAAENLHQQAPFAGIGQMGPVGYVGNSALVALRAYAPAWWAAMQGGAPVGGTFDGVVFDDATAALALAIANEAARELMVANGVPAPGAAAIVGNRPYGGLGEVAAVGGVGKATMQGLHDYAASGAWPGGACDVVVRGRADQHAADIQELLLRVQTGDYPYAAIAALEVDACVDMTSAATRELVLDRVAASGAIQWDHSAVPIDREPFAQGTTRFVPRLDIAEDSIWEHIHDGDWNPSTEADSILLSRLEGAHDALTDGPRYNPTRYYEASLRIDAEECSEDVAVLFEAETGHIWLIHRFPRC
jgi:hypothetical protein